MRNGTAVVDLDVTQPLLSLTGFESYTDAEVLCRLREQPLGFVRAPLERGRLAVDLALRDLLSRHVRAAGVILAERAIASGRPPRWPDAGALIQSTVPPAPSGPLATVAVCASGRLPRLRRCLDAIAGLDYRPLDVLVVDRATTSDIEAMLRAEYPDVRYARASGAGVEAARELAFAEGRGDILAFTVDDAVVDRYWISSIVRAFLGDPEVMVVTGLVVPHALRAGARRLSSQAASESFRRHWYRAAIDRRPVTADPFAASPNVAFWRSAFSEGAAPEAIHTTLYEPSAMVKCDSVNGVGTQAASTRPDAWLRDPRRIVRRTAIASRQIDLADPMRAISDATTDARLRATVLWEGARLGDVSIDHHGAVISAAWLTDAIAQELTTEVLDAHTGLGDAVLWSTVMSTMARALMPAIEASRRERRRHLSEAA